jgi:hypothetical protein
VLCCDVHAFGRTQNTLPDGPNTYDGTREGDRSRGFTRQQNLILRAELAERPTMGMDVPALATTSPRQTIRTHTHARTDHRSSAPSMDALPLPTGCVTSSRRFCAVFFPGRPVFAYVGSGSGGACAWPADLLFMFKSLYTSST